MTTFYLDLENGNDANDGLTFANRWKTFQNGATAARTAPGDVIRVMASPDPTLVGNATWTNGPRPFTTGISSSTNATPIVITSSVPHGLVAGDYVTIVGHTTNTNANGVWKVGTVPTGLTFQILQMDGTNTTGNGAGSGGTIQKANNCIVKLASPVTQNVALCGGLGQKPLWTASANVTTTQNVADYKEGYSCASVALSLAFTTGLAAYTALPATLNLSGYQQDSFWIKQTAGTLGAAGAVRLALCSDAAGATVVNAINIPAIGALSAWQQVTVDLGTNLGSSINSVAFYVITDNGAQTFLIDNIVACKASSSADSVNLGSLISQNGATDNWHAIQSINYDAIMLANQNSLLPTNTVSLRGYYGTGGTVATYKRETIKTAPAAASTTVVNQMVDSGVAGNLITFSGGWNRTDMSTQTGETWCDGRNGNGQCYAPNTNISYVKIDKLNGVRYSYGLRAPSGVPVGVECGSGRFTAMSIQALSVSSFFNVSGPIYAYNNAVNVAITGPSNYIGTVASCDSAGTNNFTFSGDFNSVDTVTSASNTAATAGFDFATGSYNYVRSLTANDNLNFGVNVSTGDGNRIGGGSTTGNGGGVASNGSPLYLNNFVINEAIEVSLAGLSSAVYSNRHDDTDDNSWVYQFYGTINQQSAVVDSPATTAWKLSPTDANATALAPVRLKLATVVCGAGTLVTVTARMRRTSISLALSLVCPGGQISGVASDVSASASGAAGAWETVTITFTPTKAGGVDIYAYAYGGTTFSGYVCNITASQA